MTDNQTELREKLTYRSSYSGSITGEVQTFNPDVIPEPDMFFIRMTRGERRIADELRKAFGGFKRVVIDVDGERHEFGADSLIRLLEGYEGAHGTRWHELFGTPERASRTMSEAKGLCNWCDVESCAGDGGECRIYDYDALLEWLRGDA